MPYIQGADAYTLKIRGGANTYTMWNGKTGTAGKGLLIQTDISATLGVSQDQVLITRKKNDCVR